jgi:hypothetical protein
MTPQPFIDPKAYEQIKARHSDIPQDPLPIELPEQPVPVATTSESKPRPAKSVRFASCPKCLTDKEIAVVRSADGSEVFRDHNKTIGKNVRVRCPGSGTTAPAVRVR